MSKLVHGVEDAKVEHSQAWKNTQNLLCCWPLIQRRVVVPQCSFVVHECGHVVCLGERLQGDYDTTMPLENNDDSKKMTAYTLRSIYVYNHLSLYIYIYTIAWDIKDICCSFLLPINQVNHCRTTGINNLPCNFTTRPGDIF